MKITKILGIAAIVLAAISVLSLAFTVIGPSDDMKEYYDSINEYASLLEQEEVETPSFFGIDTIFGMDLVNPEDSEESIELVTFSILPFIFYIVGIGGLVTAILSFMGKGPKQLKFVTAGCLVIFAIGLFIMPSIVTLGEDIERSGFKDLFVVGWGAWVGGIAAILGAGVAVLGAVVKE